MANRALYFDPATGSVASFGNFTAVIPQNGPGSVEFWIRFNKDATARGANNRINTLLYQHSANNNIYIDAFGADFFPVNQLLKNGAAHHIVFTYNGTHENSKLYVNGVEYPITIQTPTQNHALLTNFTISNGGCDCEQDNVRLYSRVLTKDDVLAAYHASTTPTMRVGLEAEWLLDEGELGVAKVLADSSGKGKNGTVGTAPAKTVNGFAREPGFTGGWYLAEKGHVAPPKPVVPKPRKPSAAELKAAQVQREFEARAAELKAAEVARINSARKLWGAPKASEPSVLRIPKTEKRSTGPKLLRLPRGNK